MREGRIERFGATENSFNRRTPQFHYWSILVLVGTRFCLRDNFVDYVAQVPNSGEINKIFIHQRVPGKYNWKVVSLGHASAQHS